MRLRRKLQRIRLRRFVYVDVRFCQPFGAKQGWVIHGIPLPSTPAVFLASGPSLSGCLRQARIRADELFGPTGVRIADSTNNHIPEGTG